MKRVTEWTRMHCYCFARFDDGKYRIVGNGFWCDRHNCVEERTRYICDTRKEAIAWTEAHNPMVEVRAEREAERVNAMIKELKSLGYKVTKR